MTLVRLFVFFGSLIVLALFAALIGPYFVDWSVYRADFERQASLILGQEVNVQGDASLRILPFPSVTFNDLTVGENQSGEPMLTASKFEMDLEITPLLAGEVRIFDMRVEEPSLTITLFDNGTLDWALRSEKKIPGNTLVLENISLTNGQITLIDRQNNRTKQLSNINAALSAPELSGPWRIDGSADFDNQEVTYLLTTGAANPDGHIRLRTRISLGDFPLYLETEGDAKIADKKPSYSGNFTLQKITERNALNTSANLRSLLKVQTKGAFSANNESLEISEFRLTSGDTSDPYVVEGEASIDTGENPNFNVLARGQQIIVNRAEGEETVAESENQTDFETGLEKLRAIAEQIPIPTMPGTVNLSLPAIVAGNTTVRDVRLSAEPILNGWRFEQLSAKLPGRTDIEANGDLRLGANPRFVGDLLIASKQPSGFSSWLVGSVDPEIRQLQAAGFSAKVTLSREIQRFEDLQLILGNSVLDGYAERQKPPDFKPTIEFNLSGDEINVDRLGAVIRLANLDKTINESGGLFSHDIVTKINTKRMKYGRIDAFDVNVSAAWENGDLNIEQFQFGDIASLSGEIAGVVSKLSTDPVGNIVFSAKGSRSDDIFEIISEFSGKHPLVERLKPNAFAFSDFNINGELEVGNDNIPRLSVNGVVSDSNFDIQANGQPILFNIIENASSPVEISVKAQNPKARILLSQLGFNVAPVDFGGEADIDVNIARGFDEDFNLIAKFTTAETNLTLDGFIDAPKATETDKPRGVFVLDLNSTDIEPLLLAFNQNPISLGWGQTLLATASVQIDENNILLDQLEGETNSNRFSGNISFDRKSAKPNISGDMKLQELDFEWLYLQTLGVVPIAENTEQVWSEEQFQLPYELAPELDINLSAEKVILPNLQAISDFSTQLTTETGTLSFSDISGRWYDGEANGEFSISNPDGRAFVSLNGTLENADISKMSWQNGPESSTLTGDITIAANMKGNGNTLGAVVQSINGGGLYELNNVTINAFQPNILENVFKQVDADRFEITQENISSMADALVRDGTYEIDKLAIPFAVTGGIQRISSVTIEEENYNVTGSARFNHNSNQLQGKIDLLFDAGLEAQSGATSELSLGFNGEIADPTRTLNTNALSNFLSIRAYELERRRVELLQASILEKQRLRREIALVKDQQLRREEDARLKLEAEAAAKAEERDRIQAERDAQLAAAAAAQRQADEEAAEQRAKEAREREQQRQEQEAQALSEEEKRQIEWQKRVEDVIKFNSELAIQPPETPPIQ